MSQQQAAPYQKRKVSRKIATATRLRILRYVQQYRGLPVTKADIMDDLELGSDCVTRTLQDWMREGALARRDDPDHHTRQLYYDPHGRYWRDY